MCDLTSTLPIIGSVFVVGGALFKLARDVRQDDLEIRHRDDDLGTWVRDDDRSLLRKRLALIAQMKQGKKPDYVATMEREKFRRDLRHRYRDQLRDAERVVERVQAREHWPHRLYRRLARRPLPGLTAPDELASTIASWESGQD